MNKGIYCGPHNNAFGRHVTVLLESLDFFNAALGVVPDRHDDVRPAPATTEDGKPILVSSRGPQVAAPPPISTTPELVGKEVVLPFADRAKAEKWAKQQRRAGFDVKLGTAGPAQSMIVASDVAVHRQLGTEPFMRAVLYLALTFLAHSYPDVARASGLSEAKKIVDTDGSVGERVWWARPSDVAQIGPNPFEHGHSIAISIDGQAGRVTALIVMYGAIQFGVDLGGSDGTATARFITHVDPLARRPPNDVTEVWEEGSTLVLGTPEDGRRWLRDVESGATTNPFEPMLSSISQEQMTATCESMLPVFLATKALGRKAREEAIHVELRRHDQRIFNLLRESIARFEEQTPHLPAALHGALRGLVAADPEAPRSIGMTSEVALGIAAAALTAEVSDLVEKDALDLPAMMELMFGGRGLAAVVRPIFETLAAEIGA